MGKLRGIAKKFQSRLLNKQDFSLLTKAKSFLLRKSDKCALCGEQFKDKKDITVDHIVPLSKGGSDSLTNLQLAHSQCNFKKGNTVNN